MKNLLWIAVILMTLGNVNAQTSDSLTIVSQQLMEEATLLYKSEMASWYGSDLFVEKHKEKQKDAGGYFSYSEKGIDKCVFYSKGNTPKALVTIEFKDVYSVEAAKANGEEREFTDLEKNLYALRSLAAKQVKSDTIFKKYEDTDLNLIPVIYNNQRKVYVLTGPQKTGIVVIGNDYELLFDENNKITNIRKMHNNILQLPYSEGKETVESFHTHNTTTGGFITVTDICTLMLYAKFAKWKQHIVMSDKYVSIWNAEPSSLLILTKTVWDAIYDDQEKRHKKDKKNKKN